jgi:hypothetical protein
MFLDEFPMRFHMVDLIFGGEISPINRSVIQRFEQEKIFRIDHFENAMMASHMADRLLLEPTT